MAKPAKHSLHPTIEAIVRHGTCFSCNFTGIERLPDLFSGTSFWNLVQPSCWKSAVFASSDFCKTIEGCPKYFKQDSYLRPIQYLVSVGLADKSFQLLILSNFEVNELMPWFRRNETKVTLHMFASRRTENQDVLLNNKLLQLPHGGGTDIPEAGASVVSLLLASGNLYFGNMVEQKAVAKFLGLAPVPMDKEDKEAFKRGKISKTGFVLPGCHLRGNFGFNRDPRMLMRKILCSRHNVVSEVAHVVRLLEDNEYVII